MIGGRAVGIEGERRGGKRGGGEEEEFEYEGGNEGKKGRETE